MAQPAPRRLHASFPEGTAYWEQAISNGNRICLLIRLFSPYSPQGRDLPRKQNLLNDFFSKALIRAVEHGNQANGPPRKRPRLEALLPLPRHGISESIRNPSCRRYHPVCPELYFGDEDPDRGIYGDISRMLTFYKSNIEPLGLLEFPGSWLPQLLQKVNEALRRLASDEETNINVIFAVLSFYARTERRCKKRPCLFEAIHGRSLLPADKNSGGIRLGQDDDFEKETFMERKRALSSIGPSFRKWWRILVRAETDISPLWAGRFSMPNLAERWAGPVP